MLTLRLFGPPVVRDGDGSEVRLRSRKQLGVLVYLMVERERAVARDELMEAFWGDVSRERAYQSLCQALVEIRRRIGRDAVVSRDETIRIGVPTSTDVEALAEDLERRDLSNPLQEMDWWGTADLGPWLERSRAWCRRMAGAVLLRGIAENRLAGATLRVHRCAELLYVLDPLSEAAVLALTERELLKGDVVGGIRLLRAHLARIGETLGCSPQPSVERLLRRLEAGAHPPVELVPKRLAAHASRVRPTVLVARERELAALEGEWQRVQGERRLRSCIVTGAGGIGKSSLVRRFAATVAARAQPVFVVSCQEIGAGIPFATASDLVEELLRDPAVSATDPVWLAEVSRIHPSIRERYPGVPDPLDVPIDIVRLRIAEGIMRMIESITDGAPVAIVFDDLPYMDPATQDVIAVLAKRARKLPVLVTATMRTTPSSVGLFGSELTEESLSLVLGPLSEDGVLSLVSTLDPRLPFDHPAVLVRIGELSEGNPQFVELLVQDWQQHASDSIAASGSTSDLPEAWVPPDSLRKAFARLYDDMDKSCRRVLDLLSVAQRALGSDEIGRALGSSPAEVDTAALSLLAQGVIRLDGGALCFKNELQRAYVYFAIPREARRFYHLKLGHEFSRSIAGAQGTGRQLEAGRHFLAADDIPSARTIILKHAPRAIDCGGETEEYNVIRTLLMKYDGGDVDSSPRLLLARCLTVQGRYAETLAELRKIEDETLGRDNAALAHVLRAQSLQRTRMSDDESILESCEQALRMAADVEDHSLLAQAIQVTLEAASEASNDELLASAAGRVQALVRATRSPAVRGRALLARGFCSMEAGAFADAAATFAQAVDSLRQAGLDADLAKALNGHGISHMALGQHGLATPSFHEARAIGEALRDSEHVSTVWGNIGLAHEEQGDWEAAWDAYQHALEHARTSASARRIALALANASHLSIIREQCQLAFALANEASGAAERSRLRQLQALVHLTHADIHLANREPEFAWRRVAEATSLEQRRSRGIDNNGKQVRLRLHRLLVTRGVTAVEEEALKLPHRLRHCRASDKLEVEAFLAWHRFSQSQDPGPARQVVASVQSTTLLGVLGILVAVGVSPTDYNPDLRGLDGREIVRRLKEGTVTL